MTYNVFGGTLAFLNQSITQCEYKTANVSLHCIKVLGLHAAFRAVDQLH